jgi:hypothetical protein
MKKLNLLFVVVVALVAFTACANLEKILPQNTGTWTATTGAISVFEDGVAITSDSTVNFNGSVTYLFNEDGTGVYTEDGNSEDFNWTYNDEAEQLTIETDGLPVVYDVLEFSKDEMTLFFSFEIDFFGIKLRTDTTFDMEKED